MNNPHPNLSTLSDHELADRLDSMRILMAYGGHVDSNDWEERLNEIQRRLSAHPAQRIADATGYVVTKDLNGEWNIHRPGFVPYTVINLPDDGKPWQESIYRPGGRG